MNKNYKKTFLLIFHLWTAGVGKGLYEALYTVHSRPCERRNPEYEIQCTCSPIRFIPTLPSARTLYGPLFNPRGQLPFCNVEQPTSFRSQQGPSGKDLKLRAWVPMALCTPSIPPPTVHQNLSKPFCHMWISVTPNKQKYRIPTCSKINVCAVFA